MTTLGRGSAGGTMKAHLVLLALIAGCRSEETSLDAGDGTLPTFSTPTFSAQPQVIQSGTPSLLSWKVQGATSFAIAGVGYFTGTSTTVAPLFTTQYQLIASNPSGTTTLSTTVKVLNDALNGPVISSFTIDPPIVAPGASATLSWNVTRATAIVISGVGPVTGNSVTVTPVGTTPYVLFANNDVFTNNAAVVAWEEPTTELATLREISDAVSPARLEQLVRETSGALPVTLGDRQMVRISERFTPEGRARFREYFTRFFTDLGLSVTSIDYPTNLASRTMEASGHNLEVILPGRSTDTVVVITHYDSSGDASDPANPGADDNMTGMAQIFEAARILRSYQGRLHKTVRFVAADYEELNWVGGLGLEGATQYAYWLSEVARQQGFKIVAAIDPEQSGWNCGTAGLCAPEVGGRDFNVAACNVGLGPSDFPTFDFLALETQLRDLTVQLQPSLNLVRACNGNVSDHYPFAQIHVPAVMYHEAGNNPFRDKSGDTADTLDFVYLGKIAKVGIPFIAQVVGIAPP